MDYDHLLERSAFRTAASRGVTNADTESVTSLRTFVNKYLTPAKARLPVAKVYADLYTDEELLQLISFFESSVGQRFLDAQGLAAESLQGVMTQSFTEHMEEFRAKVLKMPPEE